MIICVFLYDPLTYYISNGAYPWNARPLSTMPKIRYGQFLSLFNWDEIDKDFYVSRYFQRTDCLAWRPWRGLLLFTLKRRVQLLYYFIYINVCIIYYDAVVLGLIVS